MGAGGAPQVPKGVLTKRGQLLLVPLRYDLWQQVFDCLCRLTPYLFNLLHDVAVTLHCK